MPYVKRDEGGNVVAVSREPAAGFEENLDQDSPELAAFLGEIGDRSAELESTDQDFVRVVEDVVDLLIDKGVILFTELPASAQQKIIKRQHLRARLGAALDLLGED